MTRQLTILLVALVVIVGTAACSDTSDLEARIDTPESQLEDERNKEALNQRLAALPTSVSTLTPASTPTPTPTVAPTPAAETSTPSKAFELGLPFTDEHQPLAIMPMGETINHAPPEGHPGIDFQWSYEAKIIVAVDGIVGDIREEVNQFDGATIYKLTIVSGEYGVTYEVTDLYVLNPDLRIDDYVEYGRVLGYSQRASQYDAWTMIHWALGTVMESDGRPNHEGIIERYFFDWLCPMPYFSASERERLLLIWNEAGYQHKDKFPEICNGYYKEGIADSRH